MSERSSWLLLRAKLTATRRTFLCRRGSVIDLSSPIHARDSEFVRRRSHRRGSASSPPMMLALALRHRPPSLEYQEALWDSGVAALPLRFEPPVCDRAPCRATPARCVKMRYPDSAVEL